MRRINRGFTLIEMMITLAILGVVLAIAIPSYKQYTIRNNRAAVQAEMMQIASALERYKTRQLTYNGAKVTDLGIYGSKTYPKNATSTSLLYTLILTPSANATSWVLKALPENTQYGDGALSLDSTGRRCWNKADQNTCDLANPAQAWSVR